MGPWLMSTATLLKTTGGRFLSVFASGMLSWSSIQLVSSCFPSWCFLKLPITSALNFRFEVRMPVSSCFFFPLLRWISIPSSEIRMRAGRRWTGGRFSSRLPICCQETAFLSGLNSLRIILVASPMPEAWGQDKKWSLSSFLLQKKHGSLSSRPNLISFCFVWEESVHHLEQEELFNGGEAWAVHVGPHYFPVCWLHFLFLAGEDQQGESGLRVRSILPLWNKGRVTVTIDVKILASPRGGEGGSGQDFFVDLILSTWSTGVLTTLRFFVDLILCT